MKRTWLAVVICAVGLLAASSAWAKPGVDLQEWGVNLDGVIYDNQVYGQTPSDIPSNFNTSGFNFNTGLGTIRVTISTPGTHSLVGFLDHEMNQFVNGWMDETSAQVGIRPAGLSFQSETPDDVRNNWFYNGAPLENAVEFGPAQDGSGLPGGVQTPNDISMALGWNFVLAVDQLAQITFVVGENPFNGFYLQQTDPGFVGSGLDDSADPGSIYFTGALDIVPKEPVPEPSTVLLVASGLAALLIGKRRVGKSFQRRLIAVAVAGFGLLGLSGLALAAAPVVKVVPWVASTPLIPHDTYAGKQITLKGSADVQGASIAYTWDFGDGSAVAAGTVTNKYVIEATHTYAGAAGTVYAARLTVQNTATGEAGSKEYYVKMEAKSLSVEANIAIDEGLWYLHKTQIRSTSGGVDYGNWTACSSYGCSAASGFYGISALNINAFEANGHLEGGSPDNPYTETVARGMKWLFTALTTSNISNSAVIGTGQTMTIDGGVANGLAVYINQSYAQYQGGMLIDAIVASGTPDAVASTGPANIVGRSYRDIVQDFVDGYLNCMYKYSPGGGWRYSCNEYPDNSACQWGAIGIIPAERSFSTVVDPIAKSWNKSWLTYTQAPTGAFGYTDPGYYPWGPYAITPSGMVQMVMDHIGRGNAGAPSWDNAETFMRNSFCNTGGAGNSVKDYYYGLFSFVKSMLLAVENGSNTPAPIKLLQSKTSGVPPIDWYEAEAANGAPCDGVARTLINDQSVGGYWSGHNFTGDQYPMETAQAVIMLNRTLFEAGAPVAVAVATPNPSVVNQVVTLDGSKSFHQDGTKSIVKWEWDINNDGTFEKSGPVVTASWPALGNYPVTLRVTDNTSPTPNTVSTTLVVQVSIPPIAPTANAGGPYFYCPQVQPWYLDGSKSVNPDDGQHQPGYPGDFIKEYAWDLNGGTNFDSHQGFNAYGAKPEVTSFFNSKGPGAYLVQLRVTDNTAASFPASGMQDLSNTSTAQVYVKASGDPVCQSCISNLKATAKSGKVQLEWTHTSADHYNIYRSQVNGGPYSYLGTTKSTYSLYIDTTVKNGTTYYYVVREAALNNNEVCQSNETQATPKAPLPPVKP